MKISVQPLLTNVGVDQKLAVGRKDPTIYVFHRLSTVTQYVKSSPVPPHCFARIYSPVDETFAMKLSLAPLLTNGVVDQNVAVEPMYQPIYVFPRLSTTTDLA